MLTNHFRRFTTMKPYFRLTHSIPEIKALSLDTNNCVETAGRIIGRRKASGSLLFVDVESNGETLQVMFNQNKMGQTIDEFKSKTVEACQRGAIVGVKGYPGKTDAGEFTVIAQELSLLALT